MKGETYRPSKLELKLDWDVKLDGEVGEVHWWVVAIRKDWGEDLGETTVDIVCDGSLVVGKTDPEKGPTKGRTSASGPDPGATVSIRIHSILILKSL
jgi:hypothetical protein